MLEAACRHVAVAFVRLCYVGRVPNSPGTLGRRNRRTRRLPARPILCFSVCFFCVSCADADITVWIRARLFPSRFERVDKGFPLGIASG